MKTIKTSTCAIKNGEMHLNGSLSFQYLNNNEQGDFLLSAYRHLGIQYPRFFKMDPLCRLAFLAAEVLISSSGITNAFQSSEIGIVLSNKTSSVLTDLQHQASIQKNAEFFPSPAIFVYSLPNIMIGELSIRHKITGENTLFVLDSFQEELVHAYAESLFSEDACKALICGWIDASQEDLCANFYILEPIITEKYFVEELLIHEQ